jgi:hypothetical protein
VVQLACGNIIHLRSMTSSSSGSEYSTGVSAFHSCVLTTYWLQSAAVSCCYPALQPCRNNWQA